MNEVEKKGGEAAPKVSKTIRIQWREDRNPEALKVQIVLRVERPRPPQPDPREALLCYVDVNSSYGVVAIFASFDGQRVKVHETLKLKLPNRGRRLRETAKRKGAASHGVKNNINFALARLSERFNSKGWVKRAAEIFKKALAYARGRSVWINFDVPPAHILRNSHLRRTLLSVKRVARNLGNWYGIYATFECYPSHKCPLCGGELERFKTRRTRVEKCEKCGFLEDHDYTPFYWWLKKLGLPLPRWPLGSLSYKQG